MHLFSLFDLAFKSAVGKGVLLVELKAAFVGEEAIPSFWQDVSDSTGRDDCGCQLDRMLPTRLHLGQSVTY